VISPTQSPLPDNTQYSQETDINAPAGFETANTESERQKIGWVKLESFFGHKFNITLTWQVIREETKTVRVDSAVTRLLHMWDVLGSKQTATRYFIGHCVYVFTATR
jgi:hypothetical protein